MKINTYLFACLLSLFLFPQSNQAQTTEQKTWIGASLSYELHPNWEASTEIQHRSEDILGTTDNYFGEFLLAFKKADAQFKTGLRYIKNNDTRGAITGIENHLRFFLDLGYKHRLQQFQFKHRLRLQTENEIGQIADRRENLWRLKTGGVLKIKNWKLDPEVSIEAFNHLPNSNATGLQKWRYRLETELDLGPGKVNISYSLDRESLPNGLAFNSHIIGLFYHFEL